MTPKKQTRKKSPSDKVKPVSKGRHAFQCKICSHSKREEIEQAFVNWSSPVRISKQYGVSRDSLYRHAHAFGLMESRRKNLRAALDHIVEQAGEVEVNAAAVVAAVGALARINSRGEWIERTESVNLNELFSRMTVEELEAYAKDGSLPGWFEGTIGAIGRDSREAENER